MSGVEEAVQDAAEASIEVLETAERVLPGRHFNLNGTTKGQQAGILTGAVVLGLVAGGVGGYFFAKKRLSDKLRFYYEGISEQEIAAAKEYYQNLHAVREKPASPEEVLAQLHGEDEPSEQAKAAVDALSSYMGKAGAAQIVADDEAVVEVEVQETVVTRNIFTDPQVAQDTAEIGDDEWSYDEELRIRDEHPDQPYIISKDEYFEGEKEYEQTSLTYFEGDDTLSDDHDIPVPDTDATVGDDNLSRFGHGSEDPNMLYVRNERLELDFEIVRSPGKFQTEVLGLEDEDSLRHSYTRPGIRKFRNHDE